MGAESLSHSERIGNKIKRGAVATVAAVSSLGFVQEALSQEASAAPPTAEQFWVNQFSRLVSLTDGYKPNSVNSPTVVAFQKWHSPGYPKGVWNDGSILTSISKDRSSELSIQINTELISAGTPITTLDGARYRAFDVNLIYGKDLSSKVPPYTLPSVYNFVITNVLSNGKNPHWTATWYSSHMAGSKESGYYLKYGTVINSTNPNEVLPNGEMSSISELVSETIKYVNLFKDGYVIRPDGTYIGTGSYSTDAYKLVPSK